MRTARRSSFSSPGARFRFDFPGFLELADGEEEAEEAEEALLLLDFSGNHSSFDDDEDENERPLWGPWVLPLWLLTD